MRNYVIGAWLALQIALPASYYLGEDPFDERFAWRMFSPVRIAGCSVELFDASDGVERPLNLQRDLHVVWINLLKRARMSVIESYARKVCEERAAEGKSPVLRADITCMAPEVSKLGICAEGGRDADRDGVPDAYAQAAFCTGRAPRDCFVAHCGERSSAECFQAVCRTRPVARDENLCERVGVGGPT